MIILEIFQKKLFWHFKLYRSVTEKTLRNYHQRKLVDNRQYGKNDRKKEDVDCWRTAKTEIGDKQQRAASAPAPILNSQFCWR